MQSKATTVEQYLKEIPTDRLEAMTKLRKVILKNLPKGFKEGIGYGMMGYYVPHSIYPAGYHCNPKDPLPFAGMASQKTASTFITWAFMPTPNSLNGLLMNMQRLVWEN
jgi:hypothetical protein